ncbi:MAG: dihydrolipoyl dehydrogenase [Promethearchaeota archaeon]|nr:MAG: dihydrolipoyl dehydrogenase [Candidatus Lokiarchaeota archaeon]
MEIIINNSIIGGLTMQEEKLYDIAIIGAGPGGYHAAIRAAQEGAKVALIEKERLGGTCLNWGCIPTKALLASAHLLEKIKESEEFGIKVEDVSFDFPKIVERKNKVVEELCDGVAALQKACKNDVYYGHGKIIGGDAEKGYKLEIKGDKTERITAKRVIIATGSSPALILVFNVDHERILTSDDILAPDFDVVPKRLLVIGAGVIGCEFADVFNRFGSEVTLLEMLDSPIATEEPMIIKELEKRFKDRGIRIKTSVRVLSVDNKGDEVEVKTIPADVPQEEMDSAVKTVFKGDYCLVAIGRKKESDELGLEELGINTMRGQIEVDPLTLETSAKGIYAIGDVTGGIMLAHVASYEGDVAVANALFSLGFKLKPEKASYRVVPATIFASPTIGSVGLRRKEAKALGIQVILGMFPYNSLGKAKCMGEEGLLMILADKHTLQILGASCIGEGSPELIAEVALAMKNGLTIEDITHTIHSHPTMSEMVLEAAEAVVGQAVHKKGRPYVPIMKQIYLAPLPVEVKEVETPK